MHRLHTFVVTSFCTLLLCMGTHAIAQGTLEEAIEWYDRADSDAEKAGHAHSAASYAFDSGNFAEGAKWLFQAEHHALESGDISLLRDIFFSWTRVIVSHIEDLEYAIDSLRASMSGDADFLSKVRSLYLILVINNNRIANFDMAYAAAKELEKLLNTDPDHILSQAVIGTLFRHLGWLLSKQGSADAAIAYLRKAIAISEKYKYKRFSAETRIQLGQKLFLAGSKIEGFAMVSEIIDQAQRDDEPRILSRGHEIISEMYFEDGQISLALSHGLLSLDSLTAVDHHAFRHTHVARCYYALDNLDSAQYYALVGFQIAETNSLEKEQFDAHFALKDIFFAMENYERALYHHIEYNEMLAEQHSFDNAMQIASVNEELEREKQKLQDDIARLEIQRQQRLRNLFVIGFAGVALFAFIVLRQRNKINKARKRSDELLLNILPKETSEELKANGQVAAKHFDTVTVLFADLKGFTEFSARQSPQVVVDLLHECFSTFDQIVGKYGIEKIKTIGDAYMAAAGLPVLNKTHATDVVHAANEMQTAITAFNLKHANLGVDIFKLRIGVHSGPVVAGIVGIKKFQYDIWGDTVNTASRMEKAGQTGEVNISQTTHALVQSSFHCTPRGRISVKGKGELEMFFVKPTV